MENKEVYKPTRRNWIKLWVDEWLGGTTRFELSEKQRSIWIDLLALAGKSRFPGIIASGKYEDGYRGYPVSWYAGTLVYEQQDFIDALNACVKYGKVKTEYHTHDGMENVVVYVLSFEKYQSEYLRQKQYPKIDKEGEGETGTGSDTPNLALHVFDLWNTKELTKHRFFTDELKRVIQSKLKQYTQEEICQAIENYAEIVHGEEYYWSYKWTLKDFLGRGIDKFIDRDTAQQNYRVDSKGKQTPIKLRRDFNKELGVSNE